MNKAKNKTRQEMIRRGWWNSEKIPRQLSAESFLGKSTSGPVLSFVLVHLVSHPHLSAAVSCPLSRCLVTWLHKEVCPS